LGFVKIGIDKGGGGGGGGGGGIKNLLRRRFNIILIYSI